MYHTRVNATHTIPKRYAGKQSPSISTALKNHSSVLWPRSQTQLETWIYRHLCWAQRWDRWTERVNFPAEANHSMWLTSHETWSPMAQSLGQNVPQSSVFRVLVSWMCLQWAVECDITAGAIPGTSLIRPFADCGADYTWCRTQYWILQADSRHIHCLVKSEVCWLTLSYYSEQGKAPRLGGSKDYLGLSLQQRLTLTEKSLLKALALSSPAACSHKMRLPPRTSVRQIVMFIPI